MTSLDNTGIQSSNMAFGQRIAHFIETRGIAKTWVAERLGISRQALNYLLNHSVKPKFVDEFAEILEISPQWIETGIGEPIVKKAKPTHIQLPVLNNAVLLGKASASTSPTLDFVCSGENTFTAYKLEDDSNFPPFIESSILIFNTKKLPLSQDYVLLKIGEDIFVRQYLIDGDDICFKAGNPSHKTFINPQATILGVLTEVRYQLS
jgi:hypothetical protein